MTSLDIKCEIPNSEPSCLSFHPGGSKNDWVMRINGTADGANVQFNREAYPNCTEDEFARAVCEIICRSGYLDRIYQQIKKKQEDHL